MTESKTDVLLLMLMSIVILPGTAFDFGVERC
jgi:hypothetical protein